MLNKPADATIAAMMAVKERRQRSVRGFLAGIVRNKFRLNLISELTGKGPLRVNASSERAATQLRKRTYPRLGEMVESRDGQEGPSADKPLRASNSSSKF